MAVTVTHPFVSTVPDGTDASVVRPSNWNADHSIVGMLDVVNGGTGTATPALVAGTNVTITGTWPNNTINATGGSSGTAAANAGIAIASNVYSTIYNTAIADSTTVPVSIGGITAGTTASSLKTQTLVQIFNTILFPTQSPTYTIPTVSFSGSVSGNREIGSTISQALSQTNSKNDAGAFTTLVFNRNGSLINTVASPTVTSIASIPDQFGYADPNNPNFSYAGSYTDSYVVVSGTASWTSVGTYGAGLAKQLSTGVTDSRAFAVRSVNAPQAASTLTGTAVSVTGIYPYFWGVSNTLPTTANIAAAIAAGTANKVLAVGSSPITITFNASGQYIWLANLASYAAKTTWYNTALNNGSIGAGQFILAPVAQNVNSPDSYWTGVSFNIYISGYATTTSGSIIFS